MAPPETNTEPEIIVEDETPEKPSRARQPKSTEPEPEADRIDAPDSPRIDSEPPLAQVSDEQADRDAEQQRLDDEAADRRARASEAMRETPVPPVPSAAQETTDEQVLRELAPPPVERHECGLPIELMVDRKRLVRYVNENEHRLSTTRRKIDVGAPVIQKLFPIYKMAAKKSSQLPCTAHFFASALVLIANNISIEEEEKIDTALALDDLGV